MLPKINKKNLSKIVGLILVLNFIVIGLNLNSLDNKKQIMNVAFKSSSGIIDIYNSYGEFSNDNFSDSKKQISEIISNHVNKYFGIEQLIKKESKKTDIFKRSYPLNLEMSFMIKISNLLNYEDYKINQLSSNIQNYLKLELEEKNKILILNNKNLQDKSKFYKNYLVQNNNSLGTQLVTNIKSMIQNFELSVIENRRRMGILKILTDKVNNNFSDDFNIDVTAELKNYKPKLAYIIEKIFSYLIVLNVFIFIFLKYFKFKKK
jgi:hypothetical protein